MAAFLQTNDGDFDLTLGRLSLVTGATEKAQKINNRFSLFVGEYFLDVREGVPWFDSVFTKNPNLRLIRQLFRKTILSVPGIADIQTMTLEFDGAARSLRCEFVAIDDAGNEIPGGTTPFILEGTS